MLCKWLQVALALCRTRLEAEHRGPLFLSVLSFCLKSGSFDFEGLPQVEVPLMAWVYPVLGMMEEVPSATKDAQERHRPTCPVIALCQLLLFLCFMLFCFLNWGVEWGGESPKLVCWLSHGLLALRIAHRGRGITLFGSFLKCITDDVALSLQYAHVAQQSKPHHLNEWYRHRRHQHHHRFAFDTAHPT